MDKQDKLVAKVQKEFDRFHWELMKHTKQEIFDKAYEISIKEDFRGYIESEELSDRELTLLLSKDNTLDFLYMCWQKADNYHSDDMKDCLWVSCNPASNLYNALNDESEDFENEFDNDCEDDFCDDEDDYER